MGQFRTLNFREPSKRSKISQLPPEIRKELEERCKHPDQSLDGISDWLEESGYEVSRSSIHRFSKKLFETEVITPAREEHAKFLDEVGASEAGESSLKKALARLSTELEAEDISGRELATIARAIADVSRALIAIDKYRIESQPEAEANQTQLPGGLSEEKADAIRRKILGIVS